MASQQSQDTYTAHHLTVLEGLEAVRKRPAMYIGSSGSQGLMHCLWEIIDNAVDEALVSECDAITVTLHPDGSVEVADNGRGIPVDIEPKTGLSGVEVVFTKLHAGGKFGGGMYNVSGGLHGVGASVVNALSERLDVEVDRGGKTYAMSFRRGEPGVFKDGKTKSPDNPFTPFTDHSELRVVGKVKRGLSGTRVRYWADPQIFAASAHFSYDDLAGRARQTSFLVPGLALTIRDRREGAGRDSESGELVDGLVKLGSDVGIDPADGALDLEAIDKEPGERVEKFKHDGGVVDFVEFLAHDEPLVDTWHLTGTGQFTETVQTVSGGHLKPKEVTRTCEVDLALRWGLGYDTTVRSFVNIVATPKGGTHVAGFEQGLLRAIRRNIDANARKLKISAKGSNEKIEKEDVLAGLTAVLTVRLAEPEFEGQTKEVLGTSAVRAIVAKVVDQGIEERVNAPKKALRDQAGRVLEKVVGEMRARVSARMHKEISRRKNALETSSLPPKLSDCRSDDIMRSELFIVEGDSALGTAKLARRSDFQALLPIRGKILNVQKASIADMLKNAECASIIQVVGAGSGRTFDLEQARYGKIVLMTDADVDGAHIRTLLLTLFFRYMRPLLDEGRVYAAVPPLHRVHIQGSGGKKGEFVYTYSEAELSKLLAKLEKSGRRYVQPIQRYKGLGEMDADQLAETTMDPAHRTLRRVTMPDAELAAATFELLMGSDVAPRKEFLVASAAALDPSRIDA